MDESNKELNKQDPSETDSLESSSTVVEGNPSSTSSVSNNPLGSPEEESEATTPSEADVVATPNSPPPKKKRSLRKLFRKFNIYLLLFIFIVVVAIIIMIVALVHQKTNTGTLATQTLSKSTLSQLANSDATVGDSKHVLDVQSNAVFAGQVLVRDNLEVAGTIQVGGTLSLSGISVSGTSDFAQVQINKGLSVAGDSALQGALTVQKSLNVSGGGTFSGQVSATQITTTSLQLNGDLTLTHHLTLGGPIPSRSNGSALGGGGTASVSGSDSAGSITINTGSSPAAGCFITVNFAQRFNATPHVLVTPIGIAAGGLGYYVNRSSTNFSICSTTAAAASQTFGFDYLVLD